jgi:hypothetical protein
VILRLLPRKLARSDRQEGEAKPHRDHRAGQGRARLSVSHDGAGGRAEQGEQDDRHQHFDQPADEVENRRHPLGNVPAPSADESRPKRSRRRATLWRSTNGLGAVGADPVTRPPGYKTNA